jgi:hypothetical protein
VREIGFEAQGAQSDRVALGQIGFNRAGLKRGDFLEGTGVAAQIEIRLGEVEFVGIERRHQADGDKAVFAGIRQRAEENPIDRAENRGSGADAQSRGENRCESKAGFRIRPRMA